MRSSGNPLVVEDSGIGGVYANCSYVQLPDADVNIHVTYLGASVFDVDVSCSFTIRSNISQTGMLAFAYPSSWTNVISDNTTGSFDILSFDIRFDNRSLETWDFEWKDADWIPEVETAWHIISVSPAYVGFNVELESNLNHTLTVQTQFRRVTTSDSFSLAYIYASAQTFEGYVRETITIEVEEVVPLSG